MATGRKITVREASVKTVGISIKTLVVSSKQVTLAVFRQLDCADLVSQETAQLLGIPWGRINYHPDKCEKDSEHLHVIWQQGDELRRATISARPPYPARLSEIENQLSSNRKSLTLAMLRDNPGLNYVYLYGGWVCKWKLNGYQIEEDVYDIERSAINWLRKSPLDKEVPSYLSEEVKRIQEINKDMEMAPVLSFAKELKLFQTTWRQRYQELKDLDLLFIAV